jgi:hypothetical protein
VIHSRILCSHRTQLQGKLILGCVFGDGHVVLEGWALVSVTIITNAFHPFQSFPLGLMDPFPAGNTGDGVMRDSTGEGQGF